MNVNTLVTIASGDFTINCSAEDMASGSQKPSIYEALLATDPIISDNIQAQEGELIFHQQDNQETELVDGDLIVKPIDDDANNYSRGGDDDADLIYSNSSQTWDYITIPAGQSLILILNPKLKGKILNFNDWEMTFISGGMNTDIEYRALVEGLFWGDWTPMDDIYNDMQGLSVENNLEIQVRVKNNDNVDAVFESYTLYGSLQLNSFDAPIFNSSVFADLLGTEEQNKLELNLFKKLYYRGILPQYITRAENRDYKEDEDFVTFFKSVARYFSIILCFFRKWDHFKDNYDMLYEQMKAYGIYINENVSTIEDLKYLAAHIYENAQMRGTKMIFLRKEEFVQKYAVDGEFLRLTRNRECDELVYDLIPFNKMGWCMGNSSPLYKGTCHSYELNKTGENDADFNSISKYKTSHTNASGCDVTLTTYDGKKCLALVARGVGNYAALGGNFNEALADTDEIYPVDTAIDYEISFDFMINNNALNGAISFGLEGYDVNREKLDDAFVKPNGTVTSELFFNVDVAKFKSGEWYHVRAIVHAYSTTNVNEILCNIGFGSELYFNNPFVKYFLPKIINTADQSSANSGIYIWNYKIRPSVRGRNILPLKSGEIDAKSLGFIQAPRFFHTYFRNNNNTKSLQDVTNIIEKYLYPFDSINLFTVTGNKN